MLDEDELLEVLNKLYNKQSKRRNKTSYSKIIVTLIILLNVAFTTAVLYVLLISNIQEPTTLIVSWFAFTTGELWMLSGIKKKEIQNKEGGGYEN